MKAGHIALILALAGAVGWLAACGDDRNNDGGVGPSEPVPGALTLNLTTPNADDRALLISISGSAAADSMSNILPADTSYTVLPRVENGNSARVAVFGDITDGPVLTFDVPDINDPSRYTAQVLDAADASNSLRANLTAYSLQVQQ